MITVGLVKELFYMNAAHRIPIVTTFVIDQLPKLRVEVLHGILNVFYLEEHIWQEAIEGPTSFFGVESCDTISRIMVAMDNQDKPTADKLKFFDDKGLGIDKVPSS